MINAGPIRAAARTTRPPLQTKYRIAAKWAPSSSSSWPSLAVGDFETERSGASQGALASPRRLTSRAAAAAAGSGRGQHKEKLTWVSLGTISSLYVFRMELLVLMWSRARRTAGRMNLPSWWRLLLLLSDIDADAEAEADDVGA